MSKKIKLVFHYWALWTLLFFAVRLFFLCYHFDKTLKLDWTTLSKIPFYGLILDIPMATIITFPIALLVFISLFAHNRILYHLAIIYTFCMTLVALFITTVDLELYGAWGFRIDATILQYFSHPTTTLSSTPTAKIIALTLLFLLLTASAVLLFRKKMKLLEKPSPKNSRKDLLSLTILLLGFLVAGRGGSLTTPVNLSHVYFSKYTYANHSSINASWNFANTLIRSQGDHNPYRFMEDRRAKKLLKSTLFPKIDHPTPEALRLHRPNIIIIIWESLTAKVVSTVGGGRPITPHLDQLADEAILFSNFYANGTRSDKGLVALLSGYPAQPTQSIIQDTKKNQNLPNIAKSLRDHGYTTHFYYGGELEFANMRSYLVEGGFDHLSDINSFDLQSRARWGAHDQTVLNKVLQETQSSTFPFFKVVFTLSSHEPFDVPGYETLGKADTEELFLNSHKYTDRSIGNFIKKAKQKPWWSNTLIIITGDHGHIMPENSEYYEPSRFHIPMLWLGGALKRNNIKNETFGSQVDLSVTLLKQLEIQSYNYNFGKDLFNPATIPFAFYVFNEGIGYLEPQQKLILNYAPVEVLSESPLLSHDTIAVTKSLLQTTYQDYLER